MITRDEAYAIVLELPYVPDETAYILKLMNEANQPIWTKELPTVEGWWFARDSVSAIRVLRVEVKDGALSVSILGKWYPLHRTDRKSVV